MENETKEKTDALAGEAKKKTGGIWSTCTGKIAALWKSGTKGKVICIVGVLVILGIIGACGDDEESGGGGGSDWTYTGEYFDSVFKGFPKDEGVVYQHFPREFLFVGKVLVPIKIMQATKKGNLVEIENSDRVIWVETKRRYEDDEPLDEGYYIRRGTMEYETALGAEKRVPRYVEVTDKGILQAIQKRIEDEKAAEEKAKAEAEAAAAKARAEISKTLSVGESAGQTKTIMLPGGAKMEMVWCPAGSFTMGNDEGGDDEKPPHRVTLSKGFWMAKTEVTREQWKSVMGNNPSGSLGDDKPVDSVSWDACQKFCTETGLELPTEAQWEYACHAGRTNSGGETHPAGTEQPNAWGFYNMHGNVWEWCADWYGDYPSGAVTDPKGASSGSKRVMRGGSRGAFAVWDRSARDSYYPSDTSYDLGFRPVRNLSVE